MVPRTNADRTRRARPARCGALRARHRPARARHHRRPGTRLDQPAHARRPHRRRRVPRRVRRRSSCAPTHRCSTRACSGTAASRPARRRCSCSSSPCSGSSSCRCSSCSSCSATARFDAAVALLPMSIVILPLSAVRGHAVGAVRPPAGRRRGLAISAVGFALFATLGTDSGFLALPVRDARHRGRCRARDDAGDQRDRRVAPPRQAGRRVRGQRHRAELGAAFGVAVLGSAFNIGYRNDIDADLGGLPTDVAHQAREAPAIAVQLAWRGSREARLWPMRPGRRSPPACATPCSSAPCCSSSARCSCGSAGASRTEQLDEDELDTLEEPAGGMIDRRGHSSALMACSGHWLTAARTASSNSGGTSVTCTTE